MILGFNPGANGGSAMRQLKHLWCRLFHEGAMWPVHGRYTCPRCLCQHRLDWDVTPKRAEWPEVPLELPVHPEVE